ncbi:MAG: HAMP domain-containing histidine kinase [Bifidobacteriaceae bacterium]|jgi:two-component system sensor histidine kinase SenX3|nr:HAMP domain-containing histidine kinase [Bifidobacteriaceae bacterium]
MSIWRGLLFKNRLLFKNSTTLDSNEEIDYAVIPIVSALKQGAIFLDVNGEIIRASSKAYKMGVINDDAISNKQVLELFKKTVAKNKTQEAEIEIEINSKIGLPQKSVFIATCVKLVSSHYIILMSDITEQHQLDEIRETLINTISQFVKKPIKKIRKNFKSLAGEFNCSIDKTPECELINDLEEQTQKLYHTLNSILQFTKSLGKIQKDKLDTVRVSDIVNSAVRENIFDSKRFGVKIKIIKNSTAKILGNLEYISAALTNIINNAIIYSLSGTKVYIESKSNGDKVEIIVTDRGCGIKDQDLSHIFERFYKGYSPVFDNSSSLGLGLAIAKHTITNYGGDIKVYSKVGKGSTFIILFPKVSFSGLELIKNVTKLAK